MATRIQENFPLQRLEVFSHPTQDDYERAKDKARQLLRSILPDSAWSELEEKAVIQLAGKRGTYVISPYSQTEIRDCAFRPLCCLCVPSAFHSAPTYDRMVAEYLLIRIPRTFTGKTANIFSRSGNEFGIATLFLIAFDIALFVNLLLEVLTVR